MLETEKHNVWSSHDDAPPSSWAPAQGATPGLHQSRTHVCLCPVPAVVALTLKVTNVVFPCGPLTGPGRSSYQVGNLLLRLMWTRYGGQHRKPGDLSDLELLRSRLCSDLHTNQVEVYSGRTGPRLRVSMGRHKQIRSRRVRFTRRRVRPPQFEIQVTFLPCSLLEDHFHPCHNPLIHWLRVSDGHRGLSFGKNCPV